MIRLSMAQRDRCFLAPEARPLELCGVSVLSFPISSFCLLVSTFPLPARSRPPVISNGAGRLFPSHSLLRMRRPAQRVISLLFSSPISRFCLLVSSFPFQDPLARPQRRQAANPVHPSLLLVLQLR